MFDGLEYRKLVMEMTEVSAEQKEDVAVKINNGGRIHWVDFCRVLAIMSVVYGHMGLIQPEMFRSKDYIAPFFFNQSAPWVTVLMFFFLSGWLQNVRARYLEWRGFLHFYIPLLIWDAVCLLINPPVGEGWLGYVMRMGVTPIRNANTPLWFVNELAWLTLILPIILRVSARIRICFVLFALWLGDCYAPTSYAFSKWANVFACYVAGSIINGYDRKKINDFAGKFFPMVAIASVAFLFVNEFLPDLLRLSSVHQSAAYIVIGIATLFGYGVIATRLFPGVGTFLSSQASSVFFIYASHFPVFLLYIRLSAKYGWTSPPEFLLPWLAVLYVVVGMLVTSLARATRCRILLRYVFLISLPDKKS